MVSIVTIGDARSCDTALIVPDAESATPCAAQRGLLYTSDAALAADPVVIAEIPPDQSQPRAPG